MLYLFRTLLVHHQEQLYKLYIAFGICRYVWLLCGYRKDSIGHLEGYHLMPRCTGILKYLVIPNVFYEVYVFVCIT